MLLIANSPGTSQDSWAGIQQATCSALLLGPVISKEAEHTELRTCPSPAPSLPGVQGRSCIDTQSTAFPRKQNLGFLAFSRWGEWGMANPVPCVPKPAPALGALGLCQVQPQNAHSGGAGGTGGVWGVGRWWGHGEWTLWQAGVSADVRLFVVSQWKSVLWHNGHGTGPPRLLGDPVRG